MLVGNGVGQIL